MYLPTTARRVSRWGDFTRRTTSSQRLRSVGRSAQAQELHHDGVQPLAVEDQGHLVDGVHVLGGDDGILFHVAEEGDLGLDAGGKYRSVRHSRMSGWMPMARSSFTECWVALVFSSEAACM